MVTLFLSLVSQYGAERHTTDALLVALRSGKLVIDDDTPTVVELATCGLEVEAFSVRAASASSCVRLS